MNVPVDPVLPGLPQVLQPEVVLDVLKPAFILNDNGLELVDVKVFDVRYNPGKKCVILYQLTLKNRTGGRSVKQLLSGQLLRYGERAKPPSEDLTQRYASYPGAMLQLPFVSLPTLHMVGYVFPLDPYIPWLFEVLDPLVVKRELNHAWKDEEYTIKNVNIRFLGYTPQTRATFLYVIRPDKKTIQQALPLLIGKTTVQKSPAQLFDTAQALWQAANGQLRLARPVGCLPSLRLILQEHIQGERLGALAGSQSFVDISRRTARAIATMHSLSLALPGQRTIQTEVKVLNRWTDVLTHIQPRLANRIEQLRDRLFHLTEEHFRATGPVHGDFHHTNVLVSGGEVTLIDMDELAYGDQMVDVGRFLASLRIPSLRVFGNTSALAEAREAFLVEYAVRAPVDERRVRIYEANSLLTSAGSSFRIQRPRWPEEVEIILDEAERVLDIAACSSPFLVHQPTSGGIMKPQTANPEKVMKWGTDTTKRRFIQALEDMYRATARHSHGAVLVLAPQPEELSAAIRERGLYVAALDVLKKLVYIGLENGQETAMAQAIIRALKLPSESFNTVVLSEIMHEVHSSASLLVLKKAWRLVRPGGRLIVTVPNRVILPREDREGQLDQRDLSRLLRTLGKPSLSTDQPLHWVMMYVTKDAPTREVLDHSKNARLRVLSRLCCGEVVELGCGKGHLAKAIWNRGHQVMGIDRNARSIQLAKKLYPQIPFVRADIRKLEFPDASFDTTVLSEVLEHVNQAASTQILDKAWSLIRPGGRLVVSVPNENLIRHPNHVRQFNIRSLKAVLKQYGRPKLVADQPYKWLVMYVDRRQS